MEAASINSVADSAIMLLRNHNIFSDKFEEKLNNVREIEQQLVAVNQIADTEQQSDDNRGVVAVRDTCTAVVYGSYIKEKVDAAGLEDMVKKMEIEETFPKSIQPKGYEIKGYLGEITAQLEEADILIKEVGNMIGEFKGNRFRITETERIDLVMKKLEFDGCLEICEDYQKRAAEAMEELNSERKTHEKSEKEAAVLKGVCVAMAVGVGAGAIAGVAGAVTGAAGVATLTTEAGAVAVEGGTKLAAIVGAGAGLGGIAGGSAYGYYSVGKLTREFNEFKGETRKLDSALRKLKGKQEELYKKRKVKQDQMALIQIK